MYSCLSLHGSWLAGTQGWQGLHEEMALDMGRLWRRNLGRDDRLISDHGREARHPFLDEDVVQLLLSLPLPVVADLTQVWKTSQSSTTDISDLCFPLLYVNARLARA